MLLLTKRSQFLDFSFSFCRAARLIEMIQVSYFFAIRYHPGVKIVTCHSVSSRGPAPRFNLDNDQLLGPRPRHSHLLNILPVRVSSLPRHSPGCRDEKCERGEKIPRSGRAQQAEACLCINWLELGEFRDENLIPSDSRARTELSSTLARVKY